MPLYSTENIGQKGKLALWAIEEDEDWFLSRIELSEAEGQKLAKIKGRKRIEWLAARYLVHYMTGHQLRVPLQKDQFGKPFLPGVEMELSISHSQQLAAALIAPPNLGIDIQKLVPKLERLMHKYMSEVEIDSLNKAHLLEQLHVYWGAKEALYKAYGRRELDFCKHIQVAAFSYSPNGGLAKGYVIKNDFKAEYRLVYRLVEEYMLVYALENIS
jgi:4'-phosphopantetheinyl transferase